MLSLRAKYAITLQYVYTPTQCGYIYVSSRRIFIILVKRNPCNICIKKIKSKIQFDSTLIPY